MTFVKFESGSTADGPLATGCDFCVEGQKMVLFVTGKCRANCFYCPISNDRKGKDVVFANEAKVCSDEEIIAEAKAMDALGAGITGGDPSECLDRTVHYIQLLKEKFGKKFHIHMYTSVIDSEKQKILEDAGLDEIRYHPAPEFWKKMETTQLKKVIENTSMNVGIEVPSLPGKSDDLKALIEYQFSVGIDFANLNELEFSESNWHMIKTEGYEIKNETSSAIKGSEETAIEIIKSMPGKRIHFCSSTFKDGVQLRNRLRRRAEHIAKEYDVITDDGTLLKGIIYSDNLPDTVKFMRENYDVPDSLIFLDDNRQRIEIAAWILDEIGEELPFTCYIVEEYPTQDRMEVERIPIKKN